MASKTKTSKSKNRKSVKSWRRFLSLKVIIPVLLVAGIGGYILRNSFAAATAYRNYSAENYVYVASNQYRAQNGLGGMHRSNCLSNWATLWSAHMAEANVFLHSSPDLIGYLKSACGITASHWTENIYNGSGSLAVGSSAMYGWEHSKPHRDNLLDTDVNMTGVGVFWRTSDGRAYYTQEFIKCDSGCDGYTAPNSPSDLYAIHDSATSSGHTEAHVLDGSSQFHTYQLHSVTGIGVLNSNWSTAVGDYEGDNRSDLVAIKRASGTALSELHILSAASNLHSYNLQTTIPLKNTAGANWQFGMGDFDGDGRSDLYAINESGANGRTDIHILSAASNYQKYSLEISTVLPRTNGNWSFAVGDYNGDGVDDLFAINRQSGSGHTDVHVLNGATFFTTYLAQIVTPLGHTNSSWAFTAGDYDRDGRADLYAINRSDGSGHTAVHVLSAASSLHTYILHSVSALGNTDGTYQFGAGNF